MENDAKLQMPTWNQIYTMLRNQTEKIRHSDFKPYVIVGIIRDVWIPARILPDLLGIRALATTLFEFYVGVAETKNEPVLTQGVSVDVTGKKALLVDDIMDTGKSLKLTREHLQNQGATEVRVSTLYCKLSNLFKPDCCKKKTRRWVVFTCDKKEKIRKILGKRGENNVSVEVVKLAKADLLKKTVQVPERKS